MMKTRFTSMLLMTALMAVCVQANSIISVNCAEGSKDAPRANQTVLSEEVAGYDSYATNNWNNVQLDATGTELWDDGGTLTGAVMNFQASNGWGDGSADTSTGDGKIARGYFDDGETTSGIGVDIEVTNIPYELYDVVLYMTSDFGIGFSEYTVNGVSKTPNPVADGSVPGWTDWVLDEYVLIFENVTGDKLDIEVASRNGSIRGTLAGFQIAEIGGQAKARDPEPADEATDVPRDVVFNWAPGESANTHDVYFGASLDDVNNATATVDPAAVYKGRQNVSSYAAGEPLEFGQTYYWRIDEVNAAPDYMVFKGNVWSFTVEPEGVPLTSDLITATASSVDSNQIDPNATINRAGLDEKNLHNDEKSDMWLCSVDDPEPWIQYDFDKAYKLHEMKVWNHNSDSELTLGYGIQQARIESFDGETWTELDGLQTFNQAPGAMDYAANTTVALGGVIAQSVRITALSNWSPWPQFITQKGLSEVQFSYIPVWVRKPDPDSGSTDVDVDVILGWRAGREAAEHDVYVSADPDALILAGPVTEPAFDSTSLDLALGQTYHWRIDEVNDAETTTTWQGDLWSFTTQEYRVVDDFESYNDIDDLTDPESNRIFEAWPDGYEDSANGALIGNDPANPSYAETTIVHGGDQSIPFFYSNTLGATYSEAARTFDVAQDWTTHGVTTLGLWFRGTAGNTGQLYVTVNGSKVLYPGDPADLQLGWQAWNIPLTDFGGVNLQSVETLGIGIDNNGAGGTLYFDDIRLYPYPRELITPVQPDPAGLAGQWKLDEGSGTTAQDSSGNGHDGTLNGNPLWVAGYLDGALEFDGFGDTLNFATGPSLSGTTDFSVAAWIKTSATANGVVIQQRNGGWNGEYRLRVNGTGVLNFMVYGGGSQFDDLTTTRTVNDGNWHHVMAVRQGERGYIYIDGNLEASGSSTFVAPLDASIEVAVGADIRDSADYFDGAIDDVRIYERPLSYAEAAGLADRTEPFDKPF